MKHLALAFIVVTTAACAATKPVEPPPPEAKASVHGFPAQWLEDPEKHGLPPNNPPSAADESKDEPSK